MIWARVSSRSCLGWLYKTFFKDPQSEIYNASFYFFRKQFELFSSLSLASGRSPQSSLGCWNYCKRLHIYSVQFSHSVMSDSLWPHESQHARPPCPSPLPEFTQTHVHRVSDAIQPSHPLLSLFLLPPIPPSIRVFSNESTLLMRWPKDWSFSFSIILPKKSQGLSPLEWTGWISLQSKGLSRVFSNTTVQKHQFFGAQPSSQSNSHIHTWP